MSKKAAPKKRGRPATGRDPVVAGRVPQLLIDRMDEWAQAEGMTRSAALAPLIKAGLKAKRRPAK